MTKPIRNVLVHGANGVQGGAIARRLREEGFAVRGSVRDPVKSNALARAGIEILAADLESRAALRAAAQGIDAVILSLPLDWHPETVLRWTKNALGAAGDAGVGLLVFNSSTRVPAEPTDVPAFELRRAAEALIWHSGVPAIVLRPPLFMENLKTPAIANGIVREGVVAYPTPDRLRVSWLAAADLGAYVAAALRRPDLTGEALDIGGPDALDGPALATALSEGIGQSLRYAAIPPDVFERGLTAQFGPVIAQGIARTYHYCDRFADTPFLAGAAESLTATLSRPRLSVAEWARGERWTAP
jgi:uncharacterized protein YbjT (DUF2867 family)